MHTRNPRFKRVPNATPIWLTERDWQIIKLVHRHRFLRSDQIISFMNGNHQGTLRRLTLLFQHGYLERPRAQLVRRGDGGTNKIVYGLGRKGGQMLREQFGLSIRAYAWNERNHVVGRVYLDHAVFVADVILSIELACRKRGDVRLQYEDDFDIHLEKQPFQWQVSEGGTTFGVVPDRVFALDYADATGAQQRAFFFVEADRGTMPVMRATLSQTSFYRKLLAYHATWKQDIHGRKLGIPRFRVLTVTKSAMRVETMIEACVKLGRTQGLFLFADASILSADILAPIWHTGRPGETSGLLE